MTISNRCFSCLCAPHEGVCIHCNCNNFNPLLHITTIKERNKLQRELDNIWMKTDPTTGYYIREDGHEERRHELILAIMFFNYKFADNDKSTNWQDINLENVS